MNVPFFIARRYLSSKKRSIIKIITRISTVGIAIITAALVVLLSAFNGIETMIQQLYSEFDSDITVRPAKGKTFQKKQLNLAELPKIKGVQNYSFAIEEVVVLKHEDKRTNANLYGVDTSYLAMANVKNHIIDDTEIYDENKHFGIVGARLLSDLDGYIPINMGYETIQIYAPKRKIKMRMGSTPFRQITLPLTARVDYNREVNEQSLVVPIQLADSLMNYQGKVNALYVQSSKGVSNEVLKSALQKWAGDFFEVKTNYEKNALIYQTSKTERIIVIIILVFIFILAAFNLISSITVLFVEKKNDLLTMRSFGLTFNDAFKVFFYEGVLISGKGILIGLLLGYFVCGLQLQFAWLTMPNSGGAAFPIGLSWGDFGLILLLVAGLSLIFSAVTAQLLLLRSKVY